MPVSLYELSIAVFIRSLTNLAAILKKGEAYADEKGIPHAKLLDARLVEDMAALPYQIQRVSDTAKGAAVRVAGIENVVMADDETTFEQLQARIQKTIDLLQTVEPASMDGKEEAPIVPVSGFSKTSPFCYGCSSKGAFALPKAMAIVIDCVG
jgi:hypothetical protein